MKASSDMLGKNSWILQGSMSWAGVHVRQKPVKVVHRGVGEMANVPAGSSPARPSCAAQSSSFVVFLTQGRQQKKDGTQETGLPHHREQYADQKRELWKKETHLTHVPRLLAEQNPNTRLDRLFSAASRCFWSESSEPDFSNKPQIIVLQM